MASSAGIGPKEEKRGGDFLGGGGLGILLRKERSARAKRRPYGESGFFFPGNPREGGSPY